MVEITELPENLPDVPIKDNTLGAVMDRYEGKTADEIAADINKLPFFMTSLEQDEENETQLEALKALAYEGTADEVAQNFREQGNDCYKVKQYKDAIQYYTKAIDQECGVNAIDIACYGNRAQCNLELKNYRRCVNDCVKVLEIDQNNVKAWYRSAKAFQQMARLDECLTCCEQGLSIDAENVAIKNIQEAALKRKDQLAKLEETRKQREAEKAEKARIFKLALDSHGITRMYSEKIKDQRRTTGDLAIELENDTDPASELFIPTLFLYPIAMESDIMQKVSEFSELGDMIQQLFEQPPQWASQIKDHYLGNFDVFAPTSSGGLAKVGLKSTLGKILGTKTPDITMVDGMARLYVLPKNRSKEWLGEWSKNKQQLYP